MADNGKVEMDVICRMETHTKTYCGKFEGYSLIKTLPQKTYIEIGVFHMAGVFWGIHFYPNGIQDPDLTLALKLLTETSRALVTKFEIILLDQKGDKGAKKSGNYSFSKQGDIVDLWYMKRPAFEASEYLNDDCLTFKLYLTVSKPFFVDATRKKIIVPLSDLHQHFGELLESGEGADVTFEVDKEAFRAHRNVLAARSPVFKAQLFGSMMESKMDKITIEDMKADVFKIMLQYIYTDMLPSEVEVSSEMAQHLLAAADRYGLERLKVICEAKLCDSLDVETAATTLVLADQHNCGQLKGVCIDFVSSCDMLDAVMETDGFKYLMSCSPLLLKDLLDKVHNGSVWMTSSRNKE
ncbi:BTB/POZ and MATH domain-containing protein 2 [Rhynchospora pubera]|uniref:BTB/POZ and MATH domain-containing protein 2 n=1 Tax=Rhynchospora pubera TaxID=906938 RepID=A0AAV8ESD9_9POAL|nr:BTB/POZ and MATH domain-containing protein 2 [Rhynchospora pubera]